MEKVFQMMWGWEVWEANSAKPDVPKRERKLEAHKVYPNEALQLLNLVKGKVWEVITLINIINLERKHESLSIDFALAL